MKRHLIKYHGLDDALATSQSDASVPPRGERMWLRLSLENRLPPDAIPHPDTIAQAPAADTRSDATPDTSFFESPIFTEPGLAESPEASVTLTDTNAPPTSLPVRLSYRNSVVLGWEVYLFRISSILDSDPMTVPERLVYCPLPFVQYYAAQILCGRDPPWAALLSSWLLDLQVDCACHNFFIFDHWSYIQANFPLSSDQVAEFLLLTEPVWANFLITVFVPSHYYS